MMIILVLDHDVPVVPYIRTGGPGFSAPRPFESSSWLKSAVGMFRVILLDQRGTGSSSPITVTNLKKKGTPEEQAQYLSFFRYELNASGIYSICSCLDLKISQLFRHNP